MKCIADDDDDAIWCKNSILNLFFYFYQLGSPTGQTNGTPLPNGEQFFPSLPSPPNSIASTSAPTATTPVTPTQQQASIIPPPTSVYLPPFPFSAATHPDLLHKSPFMPYGALRAAGLPPHPIGATPLGEQSNGSRLSPASSRNSTSSPPSNSQSTPNHKINSSIELNSTNDHSSHHSSSEDSEDEQIDVVKSAFVPILRPTITATITTTTTPDSTVKEHSPLREIPIKIKCELKAPSSKKLILHERAHEGPHSPIDTKITKSPTITQQQKTVWRPY